MLGTGGVGEMGKFTGVVGDIWGRGPLEAVRRGVGLSRQVWRSIRKDRIVIRNSTCRVSGYIVQSGDTVVNGGKCCREGVYVFMQSDIDPADVLESCQRDISNVKVLVMLRSVNTLVPQPAEVVLELWQRIPGV
jgi:hypothetical protein